MNNNENKRLGVFFQKELEGQSFIDPVLSGTIQKIAIDRKKRIVKVYALFTEYVPYAEIHKLEEVLQVAFRLTSFSVIPSFPNSSLDSNSVQDVEQLIMTKDAVLKGVFGGSEATITGDTVQIAIHRGMDLLQEHRVAEKMKQIIRAWFGKEVSVFFREGANAPSTLLQDAEEAFERSVKEYAAVQTQDSKPPYINCRTEGQLLPVIDTHSARPIIGAVPKEKPIPLREITQEMGNVTVWGEIFGIEAKETRDKEKKIYTIDITDYTGSVTVKVIQEMAKCRALDQLKLGHSLLIRGSLGFIGNNRETGFWPKAVARVDQVQIIDDAPAKRVELHLHTNMSDMDGMSPASALIRQAYEWGQRAVAITDHGVVQAFPEAMETLKQIRKKDPGCDFKVIYGTEAYFVNDLSSEQLSREHPLTREELKGLQSYHMIILVKNQVGLKNLYRLISEAHLHYFYRHPCIPRSLLDKYREGLLIGSACEAGELFRAIVRGDSFDTLCSIAGYYDYLEVQPLGNNMFMIRKGEASEEDLKNYNRTVIRIGEAIGKPVIATGDVHFKDPKDAEYRKILMASRGFSDADHQAPLFMRTTAEMLKEFEYLEPQKALEIVVTNPNAIADKIDLVWPIPSGNYPPFIEGAEEQLTTITWQRAKQRYGDPLPQIVEDRLNRELDSIVKHGYSVLYMTAQKLIADSEAHGYLVGSRGSVGSSLVASMAGISEVNPLQPHYICPRCKYSEFITDGSVDSGFDLPEKTCPRCGEPLGRDGHTIPFETFLGFDGDKVPDIDLNFSGEYQANAHRYTEELFGRENVFKAGTISAIKDKTALRYVRKYADERNLSLGTVEEKRLSLGCSGIKFTTGQHPGGMIVIPRGMDVYDFTPIQHPANDQTSTSITTHFDFHAIHDNVCKLDELGHDVPSVYHHLEELTGIPVMSVPMSDPEVMSLFLTPAALGVTSDELGGVNTGTLSLPELGTGFVRGMLEESQPKKFSDLLQIAGLSHGEDVWLGNAQDLIKSGTCTISEVIGTRDSIMVYLLNKGLAPKMAFDIMEIVRKGKSRDPEKGLKEDHLNAMREHDVPQWYIDSCFKIKYMFPKAHAAAYMIAALRLAWYKVHKPLAYYAATFTVRGEDFDGAMVMQGQKAVFRRMQELNEKINNRTATAKESGEFSTLQVINEMLVRGVEVLPVDLYRSDAVRFLIEEDKIRLPFSSLSGIGRSAADSLSAAAQNGGPYCSVDELQDRAKVSSAVIDTLRGAGALHGLPESSQTALF